jgi:Cdc6-like AAA superfamily ATPase
MNSVLIVDEIDSLENSSNELLLRIFEWPAVVKTGLYLIGIANDLALMNKLDPLSGQTTG